MTAAASIIAPPRWTWSGRLRAMSTKKPRKPPLDPSAVLERLNRASSERLVVRIRRWIPSSDRIDGFVVAASDTWVTIACLDGCRLDGWHVLRVRDIQAVVIDPDKGCMQIRALKARSCWPPEDPALDLTDALSLLNSLAAQTRVAAIHLELDRPDICWEGRILCVDADTVTYLEIDTQAEWKRKPRLIDLDDITRIDIGGDYESALTLLAGPLPSV